MGFLISIYFYASHALCASVAA